MALVSPGVEVTVIDESNYIPAATNSVPYFLIATAENKVSGTGIGVAAGTLEANAGRVYLITSQRDLAATFGNPFFFFLHEWVICRFRRDLNVFVVDNSNTVKEY
jgi:hypothetical protein